MATQSKVKSKSKVKLPPGEIYAVNTDRLRRTDSSINVYFLQIDEAVNGQNTVKIWQAKAVENGSDATIAVIIERTFENVTDSVVNVAIDEVKKRIYILYGQEDGRIVKRLKYMKIKVFHIELDEPDKMGYKKVLLQTPKNSTRTVFTLPNAPHFGVVELFINPESGTIMLQTAVQDKNTFQASHRVGMAKLIPKKQDMCVTFTEKFSVGNREPVCRCVLKGDKLLISFKPISHENMIALDSDGNADPEVDVDKLSWPCSTGFVLFQINRKPHMTLTLVKIWLPELNVFVKMLAPTNAHLKCFFELPYAKSKLKRTDGKLMNYLGNRTIHMGMIYKYHLFTFKGIDSTTFVVKRLERFLTGAGNNNNCRIFDLSEVIVNAGMTLTADFRKNAPYPSVKQIMGTKFVVQFTTYDTESGHPTSAGMLYEVQLGHELRDYRVCAKCGKREKKKRKSKNGKRIATYKVCRTCKGMNFQLEWRKYPCHYCSIKCMKTDWEKHKSQHTLKAINRQVKDVE